MHNMSGSKTICINVETIITITQLKLHIIYYFVLLDLSKYFYFHYFR